MSTDVAIIGTGNVGAALARTFARHGRPAVIANTRGPDSFRDLAQEVEPWVRASTLDDALDADVLVLAIPFLATETLGALKPSWRGHIVVDATNAFLVPDSEAILDGRLSTEVVAAFSPTRPWSRRSTSCRRTSWNGIFLWNTGRTSSS